MLIPLPVAAAETMRSDGTAIVTSVRIPVDTVAAPQTDVSAHGPLTQTITVNRPEGALQLMPGCGSGQTAVPALAGGSTAGECRVGLRDAVPTPDGGHSGQNLRVHGLLQATVMDTRSNDPGWAIHATVHVINSAGQIVNGSQLGWKPMLTSLTPSFSDADGAIYTMAAHAGAPRNPTTSPGLGAGAVLGTAPAGTDARNAKRTGGLGIASFQAEIDVVIPSPAPGETYTAVVSLTAA
ncbi:MAG TPA: hypothetical protein VHT75_11275 [Acidimicrobiales bacterium]|nr:hypothetical protein [Acidimicrobiales bacterium]